MGIRISQEEYIERAKKVHGESMIILNQIMLELDQKLKLYVQYMVPLNYWLNIT